MKYYISLLFVSSILMTSCKKEVELNNNTTPTNIVPFTEVGNQMKAQSQATTQEQIVTNNQVTPAPVVKGMNPAHGQSGHRCDIPVGAPLNTPAVANKQQNTTTPAPTIVTSSPVQIATNPAETTPTAEGMNPPHGQTNHRCDIAVGAPLPKE